MGRRTSKKSIKIRDYVPNGSIPLVPYVTPGTEEFYNPTSSDSETLRCLLLSNHEPLTVGATVLEAGHKMETPEHFVIP